MNDNITYSFKYTEYDGKEYTYSITTDNCTWIECLDDFVNFLETVYKYNIKDNIRLKARGFSDEDPYSDLNPWGGQYFSYEEEDINEDFNNPGLSD